MNKIFLILMVFITCIMSINASEKMYLDEEEVRASIDAFYIHTGGNMWLETKSINRDERGLFTYKHDISVEGMKGSKMSYKEKWKCPYCHGWWPKGQKCQDPECPSKYFIYP
jgi:hypothetical protein